MLKNGLSLVKSEKKFRQGKRESSKLSNFQIRTRLKRQKRTFLQGWKPAVAPLLLQHNIVKFDFLNGQTTLDLTRPFFRKRRVFFFAAAAFVIMKGLLTNFPFQTITFSFNAPQMGSSSSRKWWNTYEGLLIVRTISSHQNVQIR